LDTAAKFTRSLDEKYSEKICAAFFRAISPAEFRIAERYFLRPRRRGLPVVKGQALVVVISLLLYLPLSPPFPSLLFFFLAENCNLPRREGMRLSVDGFLNANNPGNRNHRRQSLYLSLSPSYTSFFHDDTTRVLFYKPGWKLKARVGASISRRLLIHDYRPSRHSFPECKTSAASLPDSPLRHLTFTLFSPAPFAISLN